MTRLKLIIVVAVTGVVAALVAPAMAALIPHVDIPAVTTPTIPVLPTVPGVNPIPNPPATLNALPFFACPGVPTLQFCTTTWGDNLQVQLNALADAAGILPTDLLNQVLTLEIPTPDGAVQKVTLTVQQFIDQVAKNAVIGNQNTGILGTPEVAVGTIAHSFGYARTYDSGAARPYPSLSAIRADMPQYRRYEANLLASTPAVSGAAAALVVPGVNADLCAILTPPTTTPPSTCKVSAPVALPVAVPASPVPAGTYPPALLPKLPSAIFTHYGGRLINVQGSGWAARGPDPSRNITSQVGFGTAAVAGAKHTGGNSSAGTNLDTAPRTTVSAGDATLDPWPVYIPLFTSNTNLGAGTDATDPNKGPIDRSIDFLGFGTIGSSTKIECKNGSTVISTDAQLDALAPATGGTWPSITCTSVGTLAGDGIANFSGWPINFHDALSLLWDTKAPPSLDAANLAINTIIASLPTTQLQSYGLVIGVGVVVPYVTGLAGYWPLPDVPAPTVPTTPTVP